MAIKRDQLEDDIIKEVGSILSNNCATAFSRLVSDRINVETQFDFFYLDELRSEFISDDDVYGNIFRGLESRQLEGFFIDISKGAEGLSSIIYQKDDTSPIVNAVLPMMGAAGAEVNEEMKAEILQEVSSITMQAFISALARLLGESIDSSMPEPARDMLGSLYHYRSKIIGGKENTGVVIKTSLVGSKRHYKARIIVLLTPKTYRNLMFKLRGF
jgi:chemotaxis protein CheY-P-specific phosphatase CheC